MATSSDSLKTMARGAFPALGAKVGVVEATIDLATVSAELVADGEGALDDGDIIQAISLPAGTVVLNAGIHIEETVAGFTACEVSLGITGVDPNAWISAVDIGSSTSYVATDYVAGPNDGSASALVVGTGAAGAATDTVDILMGTCTGTAPTAGILRVFAVVADAATLDA